MSEAQAIADLAVKADRLPAIMDGPEGRKFLVLPEGYSTKEILDDPYGMIVPAPVRIRQGVTIQTTDSLVDYVNRFKTDDTILFADISSNSISARIDYHAPTEAAHLDHTANLILPYSEEWKTWTGASGRLIGQLDFARFLEENSVDITAPSGADLLETCRDLQAHRKVDFRKAVRTASDNENFEYSEETTAGSKKTGAVEIPSKFQLALPVYFASSPTEIHAFLRWKLDETNLTLGFVLHRAEHVRQAVFKQIVMDVAERTERPAVFGKTV